MRAKNSKMVLTEGRLAVSANDLARLFGRSSGAVEYWTKHKNLRRLADGKYDLKSSLLWFESYLRSKQPVLKMASLDQRQLGVLLDVSRQKITAWSKIGMPRRKDGRYDLKIVCHWLRRYYEASAEKKYERRLEVIEKKLRRNLAQCSRFISGGMGKVDKETL